MRRTFALRRCFPCVKLRSFRQEVASPAVGPAAILPVASVGEARILSRCARSSIPFRPEHCLEEAEVAMTDLEAFVNQDGRDAAIRDVRRQIDKAGVEYMYFQFVSVTGRIMGKGVPSAHWERIAANGFQLVYGSTANLFTDRKGNYIGYGPEARELVGIPEPDTFCVLPWDTRTARVFCTLFRGREEEVDGGAFLIGDPLDVIRDIIRTLITPTLLVDPSGVEQQPQHLVAEQPRRRARIGVRDRRPRPVFRPSAARRDRVDVRVRVDRAAEGLRNHDHAGPDAGIAGCFSHQRANRFPCSAGQVA